MSGNHCLNLVYGHYDDDDDNDDDDNDDEDDNMEPAGMLDRKAEHNERHRSF